jgi:ubiquinone biosynthesis monooxygenase Coq7
MRVNHVGEVCAQALYSAQALTAATPAQRAMFDHAAREELDHLAWTAARLGELDARPSLLNPLWYAGSFALGCAAGLMGNRISLGFVVETEKQVEAHLASHLQSHSKGLPAHDWSSRAIAAQMQLDEAAHGLAAKAAGAAEMPRLVKVAMATAAKVMTTTAYRI